MDHLPRRIGAGAQRHLSAAEARCRIGDESLYYGCGRHSLIYVRAGRIYLARCDRITWATRRLQRTAIAATHWPKATSTARRALATSLTVNSWPNTPF